MDEQHQSRLEQELAHAQETIARQANELARLQRRVEAERFAEELRDALLLAATTGAIAAPVTHSRLLESIVETAAHINSARAAALFLIDRETQELVFEVVFGGGGEAVKKLRLPLGHGIAGLVAATGQAIAIADAENDPRQASDIANRVGYVPKNILCVPLFHQDEIIGVLELLDKEGAPSFSASDMERLGLFANLAAIAIESSRTQQNLGGLVGEFIRSLGMAEYEKQTLQQHGRVFANDVQSQARYRHALELARLVREIVGHGDDEFKACETLLRGFADYLRTRPAASDYGMPSW